MSGYIHPKEYLFCIVDCKSATGGFAVEVVPRRVWESLHHPDGNGVPYAMMESMKKKTGWDVAEIIEGTLDISHATLKERILGGFPLMDFKPIPRETVRDGLEKIGMTYSQDLFEYVIKFPLETGD